MIPQIMSKVQVFLLLLQDKVDQWTHKKNTQHIIVVAIDSEFENFELILL